MPKGQERDEKLLEYATPRQAELLEAYWKAGGYGSAAIEMGCAKSLIANAHRTVLARAARGGYAPDHDLSHEAPPGYRIRGTSTLYDGEGTLRAQWVKTTEDRERQEAMLREMVEAFSDELPRAQATKAPEPTDLASHLAVYPVGDHHLGMYAWQEEAGADYDLDKSETVLAAAFDRLSSSLPVTDSALVAFLGDLFHYDSLEPVTPTAKNQLDSDGRYALMIRTGIRLVRRVVGQALARAKRVHVIAQAGNHDPSSAQFLAECLAAIYENEPRITIDRSPRQFHYHEHGRTLIGVCHGHEVKRLADLGAIMAADRPEAWGRTRHRYWYTGHVHHDRAIDAHGVRVESFRVLPPTDAWADSKGYRGAREMKAMLIHPEHGEVQRVSVRPEMFDAAPAPAAKKARAR